MSPGRAFHPDLTTPLSETHSMMPFSTTTPSGPRLPQSEARERCPEGSEMWAQATAQAFISLVQEACAEVAKPEWWSDEGLQPLSARVVRAAPDDAEANRMRAIVLCLQSSTWEVGPRSAAELREAAAHYERAAALHPAPAAKAEFTDFAAVCRRCAEAM